MKWMPVRKFLRGGYKTISEPTVITSGGYPIFTVMPAAGSPPPNPTEQREAKR